MRITQKILIIAVCLFAVLAIATVVAVFVLTSGDQWAPGYSTMDPKGRIELREQENGSLLVSWPAGTKADGYLIEVLQEGKENPLYSFYSDGKTSYTIPVLPRIRQ